MDATWHHSTECEAFHFLQQQQLSYALYQLLPCFWLMAEVHSRLHTVIREKNLTGLRQVTEIAKLSFFPFFFLYNWVQKFQNISNIMIRCFVVLYPHLYPSYGWNTWCCPKFPRICS